jgi:hypothetical protein
MIERRPLSQPAAADHGSIAFLSANKWTRTDLLHFGTLMVGLDYDHGGRISPNEVTAGSP